jgi:hypothetical protein
VFAVAEAGRLASGPVAVVTAEEPTPPPETFAQVSPVVPTVTGSAVVRAHSVPTLMAPSVTRTAVPLGIAVPNAKSAYRSRMNGLLPLP